MDIDRKIAYVYLIALFIITLLILHSNSYQMTYSSRTVHVDGPFKILQISDTQIRSMDEECRDLTSHQQQWPCSGTNTTAFVKWLVKIEQPDFVVFTGDNVVGRSTEQAWHVLQHIIAPVIESNVSMGIVMGNHDRETKRVSIPALYRYIRSVQKSALIGNAHLKIHGLNTLQVFLFDYAFGAPKLSGTRWKPWAKQQIDWYKRKSDPNIPTLAFGHLPLDTYKRLDKHKVLGDWHSNIYSPTGETQLWDAMQSQRVIAYSAGHNHINDFCGQLQTTLLCYSGAAGYTTTGKIGWARRARIFIWNATNVITYKRLDNGAIIDRQEVSI